MRCRCVDGLFCPCFWRVGGWEVIVSVSFFIVTKAYLPVDVIFGFHGRHCTLEVYCNEVLPSLCIFMLSLRFNNITVSHRGRLLNAFYRRATISWRSSLHPGSATTCLPACCATRVPTKTDLSSFAGEMMLDFSPFLRRLAFLAFLGLRMTFAYAKVSLRCLYCLVKVEVRIAFEFVDEYA